MRNEREKRTAFERVELELLITTRGLVLAILGISSPPPALAENGFEYNGIVHVSWWFDEYAYPFLSLRLNIVLNIHLNRPLAFPFRPLAHKHVPCWPPLAGLKHPSKQKELKL
jgi:hypothetical protein